MAITFVNLFEVQPGRDAAFMELWATGRSNRTAGPESVHRGG